MLTRVTKKIGSGLAVILLATALVSGPALAKPLPPAVQKPVAASGVVDIETFNLCAEASTSTSDGHLTMPDLAVIPIWGFSDGGVTGNCADVSAIPSVPGPQLVVDVGDTVVITLTNTLTENVSIFFPGQSLVPDMVGAAGGGGMVTYTFVASNPGTYLYEAGTNTSPGNGEARWQVPMGLYGALIVRPLTVGQAYGSATTAYDVEATLVLSEIDPALNLYPGGPSGFFFFPSPVYPNVTPVYAPKYWLINGKAYPSTTAIPALAGQRVLLRYLNAGLFHHTMTLLGTHQTVIAKEAFELDEVTRFQYEVVAETIPAGQTLDTIATMPGTGSYPLYNRQMHLTNGPVTGFGTSAPHAPGGMMTFITVP